MKANIIEELVQLIGETSPYIFEPKKLSIAADNSLITSLEDVSFEKEDITNLVKTLCSFGSLDVCRISKKENSTERNFYLAEKIRIRRLVPIETKNIEINCKSFVVSKRKATAIITVKDLESKVNLYSLEVDYYIMAEKLFTNVFKNYKNETAFEPNKSAYPNSEITSMGNNEYLIKVSPFSKTHCAGHFADFPIVPAVYMANCILQQLFTFLANPKAAVDSVEMFLPAAMPINTDLFVSVNHQKFLKNLNYFKCEVKDSLGKTYGFYTVGITE